MRGLVLESTQGISYKNRKSIAKAAVREKKVNLGVATYLGILVNNHFKDAAFGESRGEVSKLDRRTVEDFLSHPADLKGIGAKLKLVRETGDIYDILERQYPPPSYRE